MITSLLVSTVVVILGLSFAVVAMSDRRSTTASASTEQAIQLADAGTERARRELIAAFNDRHLTIPNFLLAVANETIPSLSGVRTVEVGGQQVHWRVVGASDPADTYGWVEVAATSNVGEATQTVVRRVGFAASTTFNLALLSETTDCMFCHLRVNGDVGNLDTMRPGWGTEGRDGIGSGGNGSGLGDSIVTGNVFAAKTITQDGRSGNKLNGAKITGVIEENSSNSSLPADLDGDGLPDFPPIRRDVALENATGSIQGGVKGCVIPLLGSFNGSCPVQALTSVTDGNVILEGTKDNPIVIDGDVWFEGDVVLKGYVQGIGGLYSGRNIYIAGDLLGVNPAYTVNKSGNCVDRDGVIQMSKSEITTSRLSPDDACARQSIFDETDALRLAARGNIIIGDYTETDENGDDKPYLGQQNSVFLRTQFDIWGEHDFDKRNGDELRNCNRTSCKNADHETVLVSNRIKVDGYDGAIRPGSVTSSGFSSWLTDGQFQEILSTESFTYNTWRWNMTNDDYKYNNLANTLDQFVRSGVSVNTAMNMLSYRVNFGGFKDPEWTSFYNAARALGYSLTNNKNTYNSSSNRGKNGNWTGTDSDGNSMKFNWSGNDLRVLYFANREYETQVNQIDAFLYSNQRIGGKVSMQAMSVNGGMVTRDLGVLAPGRRLESWTFGDTYKDLTNVKDMCSNPQSRYYVFGSDDCALTVNYDHRLRNGGYGYTMIEGQLGVTLDWQVADSKALRVVPAGGGR